ncbi:predicted protein [Plenodomus lingam JN3]|uniref:Predicted protein n=1 Tax=Leptosphaeria maculans (strain JN3 / isolate v23.1.3 / race Av1-4-5-6-7-8) TaxID=985895 RepID=E4ZR18_LEPMJ|nr:predicted protein [Plenodomus lingam JN3]CBX93683.1 predicted protein [Plenodomus lingam JN3]
MQPSQNLAPPFLLPTRCHTYSPAMKTNVHKRES